MQIPPSEPVTVKTCYQCGRPNSPDQNFCGGCGSPLDLGGFVSARVAADVSAAVRDRDILETESSIKVFERAWGWVKIVATILAVVFALVGGGVYWKVSDWWKAVDQAKQSVGQEQSDARNQISASASAARADIQSTSQQATQQSQKAASDIASAATKTKAQMASQALSLKASVESSRIQLQEANKIQPEMQKMKVQLSEATNAIAEQQKVLSSREDLAKQIFSSHRIEVFGVDPLVSPRSIVVPPPSGQGGIVVYMLLSSVPIQGTVQLQARVFTQPPTSYLVFSNLVVFVWSETLDTLKANQPLAVSYFADATDKDVIKTLSMRDGRVYADDQPMLKFNQPDPDFKGNKWIRLGPPPANPSGGAAKPH
jgi:hypothetical protein